MDSMQDSSRTMGGLNARLKGFLEQVNRLQEANQRLEAQIADWGARSPPRSQDWTQQEQTVNELRAQVGNLLMENAKLALQSESMKSRAAAIQARPPMSWLLSKQVGCRPSSKQALMLVRPETPAPITATFMLERKNC
ncbi:keratin, type I cytoskeletal 18-like [Notothenia coriiceps]|uniref:Keratin, type I cytoskeletal 18-like n=1 Tax=Notothenia coriiceps TaxID=8208 RepID=A0A6I9Q0N5_9TELE|nr:PREDICTED: keratin, type I cytoskeletal 18-like [Notothenia coriiceps]